MSARCRCSFIACVEDESTRTEMVVLVCIGNEWMSVCVCVCVCNAAGVHKQMNTSHYNECPLYKCQHSDAHTCPWNMVILLWPTICYLHEMPDIGNTHKRGFYSDTRVDSYFRLNRCGWMHRMVCICICVCVCADVIRFGSVPQHR